MAPRDFWTKDELTELVRLWIAGKTNAEIGEELGRTRSGILAKASRIGLLGMTADELSEPGVKLRTCMTGEHPFVSRGIHNRVCDECKRSALWRAA